MAGQRGRAPGAGEVPGSAVGDGGRAEASGPLVVRAGLVIPARELMWRFSRSSGPGGQGVNTADSRVELVFDVAASTALPEPLRERALERLADRLVDGRRLSVVSAESRSQLSNRRAARERLAALMAEAVAPPLRGRRATKPSRSAVNRRLDDKARRSRVKDARRSSWD